MGAQEAQQDRDRGQARDERRRSSRRGAARRRRPRRPRRATSFRSSYRPAPAVIGVAIRKLNRAADSRSRPANRPAEMEMPDRLIPGTRATAWAAPMPSGAGDDEVGDPPRPRPTRLGEPQDRRADDERERPRARASRKAVSIRSLRRRPGDDRRDRREREQPGQPPVRIARRSTGRGCDANHAGTSRSQSARKKTSSASSVAHVEHDAEGEARR